MGDQLDADLAALRIDRAAPRPKPRAGRWIVGAVLLAALIVAGVKGRAALEARLFKPEVAVTEITLVSPAQASVDLTSTGYVVPQATARVGAKIIGRVTKVNLQEGSKVKAGDVIFELDASDQKSLLAAAKAKVSAARARAGAAKARADAAKATAEEVRAQLQRQKKLAETGAVASSTVEDLELKLKSLDAQVAVAQADWASATAEATAAGAEVQSAESGLLHTTVTAPIDGTAVTKPAQVGDIVGPTVLSALVELVDLSTVVVETDVPEAKLSLAKAGAPCEIVLDAYPDKRLRGQVLDIAPKLNRAKATGTVKVKFIEPEVRVLPEMAARVSFLQKALDPSELKEPPKLIVPSSALFDRGGVQHVYVLEGGKVRLHPVKIGAPFAGGFVLVDGPPAGTKLVKDPPATLGDGQAVKEGST